MQMALMTSAVANGGKLMKPRLVVQLQEQQENGLMEAMPAPQVEREINVNPQHLDWVRRGMLADVEEEHGTGRSAFIAGMGICGKTGTAQVRKPKGMDRVTWFVSFAPFDAPKYVVVVMVESGGSGGGTCAPKAKEIYTAIQKMEQDRLKNMAAIE
jgi:penicillin-binding protein 2